MAENPLLTLTRLLGGVVLMQGNLGHQVLGQLLVMNTNEVALAAAFVVFAGTSGQKSAVGQMALRTVAPALAVRALINKQEQRVERATDILADRERKFEKKRRRVKRRDFFLRAQNRRLQDRIAELTDLVARLSAGPGPVVITSPPSSPPLSSPSSPPASSPASPPDSPPEDFADFSAAPLVPARRARTRARSKPAPKPPPAIEKKPKSRGGAKKR